MSTELREMQRKLRDIDAVLTHAFRLPEHTLIFDNTMHDHGVCYDTGKIYVRLTHIGKKKPLKWKTVIDTLTHELAHLVHFQHKNQHARLLIAMKEWYLRNSTTE